MKLIERWPQMCFYTRKWYPNGTQIFIFKKYKVNVFIYKGAFANKGFENKKLTLPGVV